MAKFQHYELINAYLAGHEILVEGTTYPVVLTDVLLPFPWIIPGTGLIFSNDEVVPDDAAQREAYHRAAREVAEGSGYQVL